MIPIGTRWERISWPGNRSPYPYSSRFVTILSYTPTRPWTVRSPYHLEVCYRYDGSVAACFKEERVFLRDFAMVIEEPTVDAPVDSPDDCGYCGVTGCYGSCMLAH